MKYELTFQDVQNIRETKKALDALEKAGKLPEGPVRWVGEVGFNACVARLSKERGITDAKRLCGALKGKAKEKGQLAPEHAYGKHAKKEKK